MKKFFIKASSALVIVLGSLVSHAGILPGPVVSSKWLSENMDKVQVVEVRSNIKSFFENPTIESDSVTGVVSIVEVGGHIPNSLLVDMKDMRTDRVFSGLTVKYMIPERTVFEKAMQKAGVDSSNLKPLVLVAAGVNATDLDDALRVYWQLKVYGEDDLAVLDGGMATWLLEGRPYSTEAIALKIGTWFSKSDRSDQYLATSDDVAKAIESKSSALIDGRDAKQFNGLSKRDYVLALGHLEGAKMYSANLMVDHASGTARFLTKDDYQSRMKDQGIDIVKPSISYCNSGHLASGPWFISSEIMGNKSAKLYDGSMHQWTLERRPVVGSYPDN